MQAYYNVDGRSGIDSAAILGFLHSFNQTAGAGTDCSAFGVACDRVLATHKQYTDAFRNLYPINNGNSAPAAAAVGRYPEGESCDNQIASSANAQQTCTTAWARPRAVPGKSWRGQPCCRALTSAPGS